MPARTGQKCILRQRLEVIAKIVENILTALDLYLCGKVKTSCFLIMSTVFSNTLKKLIAEGRIKVSLQILSDFFQSRDQTLFNDALLLQSNLTDAERNLSQGLITQVEANQAFAKIKKGVLLLIDEVSQMSFDEKNVLDRAQHLLESFKEMEPDWSKNGSRSLWPALLLLSLLLALGWLGYRQFIQDDHSQVVKTDPAPPKMTIRDSTENAEAYYKEAINHVRQRMYDKAIFNFTKAINLQQSNAKYYNARADALFNQKEYANAKNDAIKAILLDANFAQAYVTLAQCCSKLNDVECFYHNIELSMKKHFPLWEHDQEPGIFEHTNESRYKQLITRYNN